MVSFQGSSEGSTGVLLKHWPLGVLDKKLSFKQNIGLFDKFLSLNHEFSMQKVAD